MPRRGRQKGRGWQKPKCVAICYENPFAKFKLKMMAINQGIIMHAQATLAKNANVFQHT